MCSSFPSNDTVPPGPAVELGPTGDTTETQGPERGLPRVAWELRSEFRWVL